MPAQQRSLRMHLSKATSAQQNLQWALLGKTRLLLLSGTEVHAAHPQLGVEWLKWPSQNLHPHQDSLRTATTNVGTISPYKPGKKSTVDTTRWITNPSWNQHLCKKQEEKMMSLAEPEPQDLSVSPHWNWGSQTHATILNFTYYMGAGSVNSSPQVCSSNALHTQPSPQT